VNDRAFDPNEILDALDRHGVDYVIVGGVALPHMARPG
jgi:hypothetical protein